MTIAHNVNNHASIQAAIMCLESARDEEAEGMAHLELLLSARRNVQSAIDIFEREDELSK